MKSRSILVVVRLLFSATCAHAATVTPATATDYLFSTPLRPTHIKGVVMGSPPAYSVPRSEDQDWLNEALRERLSYMWGTSPNSATNTSLAAEFGKWDLDATNRYHRWSTAVDADGVTNVVIGYHLVTNTPPTSGSPDARTGSSYWHIGEPAADLWNPTGTSDYLHHYLDPDATLVTDVRTYDGGDVWTNNYTAVVYTNGWTNVFSTISVPMTNGAVSVHTNQWFGPRRFSHAVVYTNVTAAGAIHYCHTGNGAFPGYTNAPPIASRSHVSSRFDVPAVISNDYVALRGATRLSNGMPQYPTTPPSPPTVMVRSEFFDGELDSRRTNSWAYSTSFYYVLGGSLYSWWEEGDEQGEYVKKYGREAYEDLTIQDVAMFETQFPSALVAGTGGVRRVEVEAVYAVVDSFAYSVVYEDYDTDTYDSSSVNVKAIVRIPSPELDVSRAQAYVKIHLNPRDVLESVALAAGVPDPPEDIAAFTPGLHYTKEWRMTCNQFILFYRIHPSSKFDNW